MEALQLDPEDEWLREYAQPHLEGYATVSWNGELIHRIVMGSPPGLDIDHINGDRLDNRKSNLRAVSRSENNMNSDKVWSASGYKGVGLHKQSGLWYSRIKIRGKVLSLGYHKTPELAHHARLLKEREVFGIQPQRRQFFVDAGLVAC